MSVEAIAVVLHHSRAKGAAKLVLIGVANHSGDGGAWPTVATLARYANISERAVQQSIGKLVQLGELAVHRQAGGTISTPDDKRPNRYEVLVRCPQLCDGTTQHRVSSYPQVATLPYLVPGLERSERVKQASPGEAAFTPRGEAGFTRTVNNNPVTNVPTSVTTPREDCSICSRPHSVCRRLYVDDHDYVPIATARGNGG